jgi:hypothetical protein
MTGTRANWPLSSAVPTDWVSTRPSTFGTWPPPWLASSVSTGSARRHAALWSAQPAAAANVWPSASASARDGWVNE